MHIKFTEPTPSHHGSPDKHGLDQRCDKTMYHAVKRLLHYAQKELLTHPLAGFFLSLEGCTYSLSLSPNGDVTARDGTTSMYLAQVLVVNWDAICAGRVAFYCTLPATIACTAEPTVDKTSELRHALGFPISYSHE